MSLNVLAYSTIQDTATGQRFMAITRGYAALQNNVPLRKLIPYNVACRIRYGAIACFSVTAMAVHALFASFLRVLNVFVGPFYSLSPLSKKMYVYAMAQGMIFSLCVKGGIGGPQYLVRIPEDIVATERQYIASQVKRFKDEFRVLDGVQNVEAVRSVESLLDRLWDITAKEKIRSLDFTLSHYDHFDEFNRRYNYLFDMAKNYREGLIVREF